MALKAGLVGVNPKGVDKNGMPIGSGGSVDAYTKAETNTLLNGKVSNSQLTANNKAFHFAYDSTSEKYGYKLDGTGDFIPFENAGAAVDGWNKPADLITTGLTYDATLTYVSGGYVTKNGVTYLDLTVANTETSGTIVHVYGLPHPTRNTSVLVYTGSTPEVALTSPYLASNDYATKMTTAGQINCGNVGNMSYLRFICQY